MIYPLITIEEFPQALTPVDSGLGRSPLYFRCAYVSDVEARVSSRYAGQPKYEIVNQFHPNRWNAFKWYTFFDYFTHSNDSRCNAVSAHTATANRPWKWHVDWLIVWCNSHFLSVSIASDSFFPLRCVSLALLFSRSCSPSSPAFFLHIFYRVPLKYALFNK